jgi:ACS family hexuronate transporter-like MFS transporter
MGDAKLPHLRWYICGLLFLATLINYLDRQTVPVLNETLKKEIGWDDAGFGWVNFAFQTSYAIGFPIAGGLLDRFGVRTGMAWAVLLWSAAAMSHALARSAWGFAAARFALGLAESANFPASIKAVAEWFPRRQRALATALFNNGTNVGAMAVGVIAMAAAAWGWQAAFLATGTTGLLWLGLWWWLYRAPELHPLLSAEEKAIIQSDHEPEQPALAVHWTSILRYRQAWAFLVGKLLTDPVWVFYLTWLPSYLSRERGLSVVEAAKMLVWPYLAADVGSIAGGWFSGRLIRNGVTPPRARFAVMAAMAACMPVAAYAAFADSFAVSLALISVATAAHQAWSANIFTLASDLFPKKVVGSVVGLGGMCGAIGNMFMALITGGAIQWFGQFKPLFVVAGCLHVTAFALVIVLAGRDPRPADVDAGLKTGKSRELLALGAAVSMLGAGLAAVVLSNWDAIVVAARSPATAASGLTAAVGVLLLGLALLYAGRGRTADARQQA